MLLPVEIPRFNCLRELTAVITKTCRQTSWYFKGQCNTEAAADGREAWEMGVYGSVGCKEQTHENWLATIVCLLPQMLSWEELQTSSLPTQQWSWAAKYLVPWRPLIGLCAITNRWSWGSTNCSKCKEKTCYGHFLSPEEALKSSITQWNLHLRY